MLRRRLDLDKPHGRPRHRLADRLRIRHVVLVPLHVSLHVTRRHQTHPVPQRLDLPRPVMRGGARLNANQTRRLLPEEGQNPTPPQLPADDHATLGVNAVDPGSGPGQALKYVLRKINAYRDNFVHGRLLFPCGSSKPPFRHIAMPSGGSRPLHQERTLRYGLKARNFAKSGRPGIPLKMPF